MKVTMIPSVLQCYCHCVFIYLFIYLFVCIRHTGP